MKTPKPKSARASGPVTTEASGELLKKLLAVISTIIEYKSAVWWVGLLFFTVVGFVYWAFGFPTLSPIHPINWIASYCAFALFVALLARLVIVVVDAGLHKTLMLRYGHGQDDD